MNPHDSPDAVSLLAAGCNAPEMKVPEVVGKLYDIAKPIERCRILEYLLKPLGALALVGVCNGIFTKIWFRSGWNDLHIRPEDAQAVRGIDVISLVDYVQQASSETINGLIDLLSSSPMMVYSASAAMLVAILVRHSQSRRTGSGEAGDPPDSASLPA